MVAMNKLVIPAILAAVMVVAVGFAVAPVQQASTVHTTIISTIGAAICAYSSEAGANKVFHTTAPFCQAT